MSSTVEQMQKIVHSVGWDAAWEQSVTPWRIGKPAPALYDLVAYSKFPLPSSGRVLVPGCGDGHDVIFLSNASRPATGLDISPLAVEAATKNREAAGAPSELAQFATTNFFELSGEGEDGKYAIIFDYTFLCAINPELRASWSSQMSKLVQKDGVLITIMFPLHEDREGGPPFVLSKELYHQLLDDSFELVYFDPECPSPEGRKGREALGVWRRK